MKAVTIQLYSVFVFAVLGCTQAQKYSDPYEDVLARVPPDLRMIFPESIDAQWARITFNEVPFSNEYRSKTTFYYIEVVADNFDVVASELYDRSMANYKFSDSCNIVVNKFQRDDGFASADGRDWLYNGWVTSLDSCSSHFPIPNFAGLEQPDFIKDVGLSDDYEILVKHVSDSMTFSKRYYGPQVIMPDEWSRGHSYGVCINDQTKKLIWWLVIW